MAQANPAVDEAVARIRKGPGLRKTKIGRWLDLHRDDVVLIVDAKGPSIAAAIFGMSMSSLQSWRHRKGLQGNIAEGQMARVRRHRNGERPDLVLETPPPDPPTNPEKLLDASYIEYLRGQRDAYREMLKQILDEGTMQTWLRTGAH